MDYERVLKALADYDGRGHGVSYDGTTGAYCAAGWMAKKAGWNPWDNARSPIDSYLNQSGPYGLTIEELDRITTANDGPYRPWLGRDLPGEPEERVRRVRACVQEMRDMVAPPVPLAEPSEPEVLCSI